jgi:hypothetical protein
MNEPFCIKRSFSTTRKGFALILTLSVLAVIIELTGVLVGYLDSAREKSFETKAVIQGNLYFSDIKQMISRFKERKTLYSMLYLGPLPLQSEDGKFSLTFSCHPMDNGININWLGLANNEKMQKQYEVAKKVFDTIIQRHNIQDPARLEEMLLEAINGVSEEVQSRLRQKNGIMSYQYFEQLLERYQLEADDKNIGKVPWRKYFVFHLASKLPKENLIAGDYLSADLLSALFDIDVEILKEEWTQTEGAFRAFLSSHALVYDKALFSENFINRSECEVYYGYGRSNYMFMFADKEGEVKNFEFYGKQ